MDGYGVGGLAVDQVISDFVFTLEENFPINIGKRVMCFRRQVDHIFRPEGFFIVVSRRFCLYGPVVNTGPMVYSDDDLGFVRKEPGTPNTYRELCPWRLPFQLHPDLEAITMKNGNTMTGLPIQFVPELNQFGNRLFYEFHTIRLDDILYNNLRSRILEANNSYQPV